MNPRDVCDAEDSVAFCRHLRRLQAAAVEARAKESAARSAHAAASRERREAESKVRALLEEDLAPLPLFDRPREPETPVPDATETAPKSADLPWDRFTIDEPGVRNVADLTPALSARCRLCMHADGQYAAVFDSESFGNWSSADLRPEEYSPSREEVAAAASEATGLPLTAGDSEPVDGRLWYMRMELPDERHPEPWRFAVLPAILSGPIPLLLRKAGIEYLGTLAARIESGPPITSIKGITEKGAATLLGGLRSWWVEHTAAGEAGERPAWLAPWPEPAPTPPATEAGQTVARSGPRTMTLHETGLTVEALGRANVVCAWDKAKGVLSVSPVKIGDTLYVCNGGVYHGSREPVLDRSWNLLRLYEPADYCLVRDGGKSFASDFPPCDRPVITEERRKSGNCYAGVRVKVRGELYIIGPSSEALCVVLPRAKAAPAPERERLTLAVPDAVRDLPLLHLGNRLGAIPDRDAKIMARTPACVVTVGDLCAMATGLDLSADVASQVGSLADAARACGVRPIHCPHVGAVVAEAIRAAEEGGAS